MSLINDPLQRAKQAADAKPPVEKPKDLDFRPAPPESQTPQHPRGIGLALSVSLAVIALLGLLLLWPLFVHNNTSPQEVRASTLSRDSTSPVPAPKASNNSTS